MLTSEEMLRLLQVLACRARLEILATLAARGELSTRDIADQLPTPISYSLVCRHLVALRELDVVSIDADVIDGRITTLYALRPRRVEELVVALRDLAFRGTPFVGFVSLDQLGG